MNIKNIIPGTKSITYLFDNYRSSLSALDRSVLNSQEYSLDPDKIACFMRNPDLIRHIKVSMSQNYPCRYIILDGYHRFTAAVALGLKEVSVKIV